MTDHRKRELTKKEESGEKRETKDMKKFGGSRKRASNPIT